MVRQGMGKGMGKGYKNLQGRDPKIHSDSARGRKQPQKISHFRYGDKPLKSPKYTGGKIYSHHLSELYDRWEKEVIYDVATDTIDNLYPTDSYQTYEVAEFVADEVKDFKIYQDTHSYGDNYFIVKNIKGRGFPDYDDVMEKVAKQMNMPVEDVKKQFDRERFDSLFWDDLQFVIDDVKEDEFLNLDEGEFAVVGRSGGYWGLKFSSGMVEFDKKKGREKIKQAYKEKKKDIIKSINNQYEEGEGSLFDNKGDFVYNVSKAIQYEWSPEDEDINDMVVLSDEYKEKFKKVNDFIEGTIKDFESSDRWVDTIISNEYIEKPLTPMEKAQQDPSQRRLDKQDLGEHRDFTENKYG